MSQAQYDAIIEMSDNNGLKSPFEMVQNQICLKVKALAIYFTCCRSKRRSLKAANDLLQKRMQILL